MVIGYLGSRASERQKSVLVGSQGLAIVLICSYILGC